MEVSNVNSWVYDRNIADNDIVSLCKDIVNFDENSINKGLVVRPESYYADRNHCISKIIENNFILDECEIEVIQRFYKKVINSVLVGERYEGRTFPEEMIKHGDFHISFLRGHEKVFDYVCRTISYTIIIFSEMRKIKNEERMSKNDFLNFLKIQLEEYGDEVIQNVYRYLVENKIDIFKDE